MIAVPARPQVSDSKRPQDTVAGCRGRAEADLLASLVMAIPNERRRLETSAASWSARADMLQRLDDNHEARKAKVARSGAAEDEVSLIRL
jgi:predicted RNA polymerase sigma factor